MLDTGTIYERLLSASEVKCCIDLNEADAAVLREHGVGNAIELGMGKVVVLGAIGGVHGRVIGAGGGLAVYNVTGTERLVDVDEGTLRCDDMLEILERLLLHAVSLEKTLGERPQVTISLTSVYLQAPAVPIPMVVPYPSPSPTLLLHDVQRIARGLLTMTPFEKSLKGLFEAFVSIPPETELKSAVKFVRKLVKHTKSCCICKEKGVGDVLCTAGTHFTCSGCVRSGCTSCGACGEGLDRRGLVRAGVELGYSTVIENAKREQRVTAGVGKNLTPRGKLTKALTLSCPKGCAFPLYLDGRPVFTDCLALQCQSCGVHFCGWCLGSQDSHDSHRHVANCPRNPLPGTVFTPFAKFERFHQKRQAAKVKAILDKQSKPDRKRLVRFLTTQKVPSFGLW
eukprot:TRINITY_DN1724_c1_g1_i2.p1 TRINITY_DN1724_c1_g1~~TRINITY_DN1724_c1_g1_i2.p1  ORF type:complete len:413 (+),score=26.79 TRINITY_DN1724_c1_g1_i2:50-1240(+)